MKIGIVTFHKSHNYGALLQAIATRYVLVQMGHEVYYVDYWPEYKRDGYRIIPLQPLRRKSIFEKFSYLRRQLQTLCNSRRRYKSFIKFINTYIQPFCKSQYETFDIVIYGSDQIWRKDLKYGGYDFHYFGGDWIKASRHVSYAASAGILPSEHKDVVKFRELLRGLDIITVREKSLQNYLESIGQKDCQVVLDPTLLLGISGWNSIFPIRNTRNKKYVLVYLLHNNVFDMFSITNFAHSINCEVVTLFGKAIAKEKHNEFSTVGPAEFVDLIRDAEVVFSSSFHGLVFSIIYEKQFYVSMKDNLDRVKSLLNYLDINGRLLSPGCKVPVENCNIDYINVNNKLNVLKQTSLDFLSQL